MSGFTSSEKPPPPLESRESVLAAMPLTFRIGRSKYEFESDPIREALDEPSALST